MTRTLLAIESSTDWLSVALLRDEAVVTLHAHDEGRRHASALLPMIDAVLCESGTRLDDLDALGIATGPGSFTSLRIGLATAKGLGFGRSFEAVGVSTLEAMALATLEDAEAGTNGEVVAMLDARRGEWYAGGWSGSSDALPHPTLPEGLYAPRQLAERLTPGAILRTPHAAMLRADWKQAFAEAGVALPRVLDGPEARPRADWVGRLAQRRLSRGEGASIAAIEARYLRRAEAEAKRLGGPVEDGEVARVDPDSD